MKRIYLKTGWMVLGLGLLITAGVWARRSQDDAEGFPDYNRLEYAKPLPPADQQVPQAPPGSINMKVGGKKAASDTTPLEELPVRLRQASGDDSGEPPLDFIETAPIIPASAPIVSTTTASIKTAPDLQSPQ